MSIKPCGHRLVVKPIEVKSMTDGGLHIPETVRDTEQQGVTRGVIVAVGSECWDEFPGDEPWAKEGDTVIFAKYGGLLAKDNNGEEYRILNDEDIVAVIE
jgi:co-chaperonin GroES (HSP10)